MKKILVILLGSTFFLSCDPVLINNYVVENKSNYLVETKFRMVRERRLPNSPDTIQTILIEPNSKIEIVDYPQIGIAYDKKQDFLEEFDTILIRINGMGISQNIFDRNNWDFKEINKGLFSVDEVEYNFIIEN